MAKDNKNNQIVEEQGLVPVGEQPQNNIVEEQGLVPVEGAPRQEPQQNTSAAAGVSEGRISNYFGQVNDMIEESHSFEGLSNYAIVTATSLRGAEDDPEGKKLRGQFNAYSKKWKQKANELSYAKVSVANKEGKEAANEIKEDEKDLADCKRELAELSRGLEAFMRKNPQKAAVSNLMERTKQFLPNVVKAQFGAKEGYSYHPAPGDDLDDRKEFMVNMYNLMVNASAASKNAYVNHEASKGMPDKEFMTLQDNLKRGFIKNFPEIKAFQDFPQMDEKTLHSMDQPGVMNAYLKKVDDFLIKNNLAKTTVKVKGVQEVSALQRSTKLLKWYGDRVEWEKEIDEHLREVEKVFSDPKYSAEERNHLLSYIESETGKLPYSGHISPAKNYYNDPQGISKYFKELGEAFAASGTMRSSAKITHTATLTFSRGIHNTCEAFLKADRERTALKEVCKPIQIMSSHGAWKHEARDAYANLQTCLNDFNAGRWNHTIDMAPVKERLADLANDLGDKMIAGNPNKVWTPSETVLMGQVVDILKATDPNRAVGLEEKYGIRKTDAGYQLGGGPALVKDFAEAIQNLKTQVLDADPALMPSSPEYRALRTAAEKADREMAQMVQTMMEKKALGEEELQKVSQMIETVGEKAEAYANYKIAKLGVKKANTIETKRMNVAADALTVRDQYAERLDAIMSKNALKESPEKAIDVLENRLLAKAEPTRSDLAKMVYLQTIRKSLENKNLPKPMKEMLSFENFREGSSAISRSKAFEKAIENFPKGLGGKDAQMLAWGKYMGQIIVEQTAREQGKVQAQPKLQGQPQVQGHQPAQQPGL